MDNCGISLRDVNLYYPSAIYNARTLKQAVFELVKLQKPKVRLDDVHALRGLSLEVREGERIGVIGANGAGKSTLLKAIANLYPIRSGSIEITGKVRSLFDLSLGFEIEATGRENIAYRGLLLGETPASIARKTKDIVEFAEIGEFIDYPIKTYSSGMLVRLAFAISTMVDGDVLLLDEVFGAGDANFMNKAKTRIKSLIENAKILIFVSHDFSAVKELCQRVVWLEKGTIVMDGAADDVIRSYLDKAANQ